MPTIDTLANSTALAFKDALCTCSATTTTITIPSAQHICFGAFHTGEVTDMHPKTTIGCIAAIFAGRAVLVSQSALTHGRRGGRRRLRWRWDGFHTFADTAFFGSFDVAPCSGPVTTAVLIFLASHFCFGALCTHHLLFLFSKASIILIAAIFALFTWMVLQNTVTLEDTRGLRGQRGWNHTGKRFSRKTARDARRCCRASRCTGRELSWVKSGRRRRRP